MKDLINILKRMIIGIIVSYVFVIGLFFVLVILPQKNQIIKYKTEKELLEYNYMRVKNNPTFFHSIKKIISIAEDKIKNFEWLTLSDDPNLAIYEYLENLSLKTGTEIITIKNIPDKNDLYYLWEVKLQGDFRNFIPFIWEIENGQKYLRIEEIEVLSNEEKNKDFFNVKIAGIKKVK
ncbi:MAG: hypothetical protein NC833_06060 [Candidatus Omnitrophica bacterium]|nr:hypothetical protein [Candidatus Omnitrophota bacterium]